MKIVHFTGAFLPKVGGAEVVVHSLALEQSKMGHAVYVLNGYGRGKNAMRRWLPYQLLSLPPRHNMVGFSTRRLQRTVLSAWLVYLQMRFRFDVWHLHYAYPIGSALPLLQRLGIEPVLTCHGIDINTLPALGYGLRLDPDIDRQIVHVLRRCKKLVAIGSDIRIEFLAAGCVPTRIFDIPNGVAFHRINSIARDVAARKVRDRYHVAPEAPIILTVGRNHPAKGFELIPAMVAALVKMNQPFVWMVVGRNCESLAGMLAGPGMEGYLRIVGSLGPRVDPSLKAFLLPSAELAEVFRAADIFAFPTRTEGMPLVVLEAMAAGLPVVTTDAPGVRDLVESGVNGFLSRVGDAQGMAQKISTLLADPQLRGQMGARGQQKAKEYDWPIVARKYVDLYRRSCS
jgi:glycosyltransferase involved in cell wall biosynthesis